MDDREQFARIFAVKIASHCLEVLRVKCPHVGEIKNYMTAVPLPDAHLVWMCREVTSHCAAWDVDKLHRWAGFVQGVMTERGYINLEDERKAVISMKETVVYDGQAGDRDQNRP